MSTYYCFVMMPFNAQFQSYYELIFSPAVSAVGFQPLKVDEIYTPTQISQDIYDLIESSSIVLADVTGKNPNVNYELGIAHALGKQAVIITQTSDDVPFDYRHLRYILYDTKFAGWEDKLRTQIEASVRSTLSMNTPTTSISGAELRKLVDFLENTALEFSYDITKISEFISDERGNCTAKQKWTIKARSDITHFIYGIVGDVPGSIRLHQVYDKTNGAELNTIVSVGEENRARYIIFLSKMLKANETLSVDFDFSADGYLANLFDNGEETMFQRSNSRRGVFYKYRKDVYVLPANDFTRSLSVRFNGSIQQENYSVEEKDGTIRISIELDWEQPSSDAYSYVIGKRD